MATPFLRLSLRLKHVQEISHLDFGPGAKLLRGKDYSTTRAGLEAEITLPADRVNDLVRQLKIPKIHTVTNTPKREFIRRAKEQKRQIDLSRVSAARKYQCFTAERVDRPVRIWEVFIDQSDPKEAWIYLSFAGERFMK